MNEAILFLETYGYLAVLIGSLFEGELILFVAGILSHQQLLDLNFTGVYFAAAFGALIGDNAWFLLGRYRRTWVSLRMPRAYARARAAFSVYEKRPQLMSAGMRFMYGFRTLVPLSMGLSHVPYRTFLLFNALGALAWSAVMTSGGYFAGVFLVELFGKLPLREIKILLVVAAILGIAYLAHRLIERGVRKVAQVPIDSLSENK
ncbi:hypothetical protein A3C87_01530 [Candidatus Kaiserbacteria bacterium RIFCSPHIGHO2_02_FULL_49_34]|uniref:VTT domain-containing protein n=1 Tax=Candidatus Kaiserbacteria bacterium RIFCSPHIGHO2_02_FULL_49_34 TaxID=1798491 RepID=A0A1F6DIH9_9BACT|nr:MAG: hypothetical protein A3C87_01530 [Candidatus Kaiserbacteria bacterium RIFCSPHIGHO2_02_FULL_49_34]